MDFFLKKKILRKSLGDFFFFVENSVSGPRITLVIFNTYRELQIMGSSFADTVVFVRKDT